MNKTLLLKVKQYIDTKVSSAVSTIELKHGVDGKDGKDGRDGKDAAPAKDGVNGINGIDGKDGIDGVDGKDGMDGVGIEDVKIDLDGHLTVLLTDGNEIDAGSLESLLGGDSGASKYFTNTRVVDSKKTWVDYTYNWTAEPVSLGAVAGGEKFEYTFTNGTLYRFVPDPYVPTQDAYYKDTDLTDLVIARGGSI